MVSQVDQSDRTRQRIQHQETDQETSLDITCTNIVYVVHYLENTDTKLGERFNRSGVDMAESDNVKQPPRVRRKFMQNIKYHHTWSQVVVCRPLNLELELTLRHPKCMASCNSGVHAHTHLLIKNSTSMN